MRVKVSGNACIIDEEIDISVTSLDDVNEGKEAIAIRDIALKRYQITKFLETIRATVVARKIRSTRSAHYSLLLPF
jgi:hypothetical protein